MQQEAINELALIGSAKGNVFTSQGLSAFSGRVVSSPTVFPFANGIGLMGEAGPEAILPLKRGRDGKLGITSSNGGSMQTVNVYQTNNIDSRSDKASIMQGLLTIKEQTKAEILESMRRGGVFART
jgi:lambda family phage tail tape measure protein